jgi:hypothetical protein
MRTAMRPNPTSAASGDGGYTGANMDRPAVSRGLASAYTRWITPLPGFEYRIDSGFFDGRPIECCSGSDKLRPSYRFGTDF